MAQNNAVTSKYYSGQGIVLIASRDANGKPMGFRNVGNVGDLSVDIKTNSLEHKETSTGVRGIDLRLTTEINCSVKMTLESFDKDNFALALRGEGAAVAGATVTNELVTLYPGMTTALSHINVTAFTSLISTDAIPVTYVKGTDYFVNEEVGSITVPATGVIATAAGAAGKVTANANYTFGNYDNVEALTLSATDFYLRFEGLNTADGNKPCVVEVFKFQADPLKTLALINDKIADISIEGSALADLKRPAGTSYYFREMLV